MAKTAPVASPLTPPPSPPAPAPHRPIAGIILRLLAVAALGLMFALVKVTAGRGVSIVESVFYRQLFAMPLVLGWVIAGPGFASLRTDKMPAHITRMIMGLSAMTLNFLGMEMLPLAEATVIGFAVPLFATIFAALLLKEPTGPWRWGAVVIGFVGVVIVWHPTSASLHSTGALVALAGAVATAAVTIFIRQLGATEAATTTVFWFTLTSLVPLAALMLFYGQRHDATTWALLLALGLSGGVAQLLLTGALRFAPVSVVLPMDYTGLIWASLFGWLWFDKLPVKATLIGAPIIIASGLVILWREHRAGVAIPPGLTDSVGG